MAGLGLPPRCRSAPSLAFVVGIALAWLADSGDTAAAPESRPPLPPLANAEWMERLPLADGNVAFVTPPLGACEPRPVVVAVHGAGDRAEWACGGWRIATKGHAFVVCPQGLKMDAHRFAWDGPLTIAQRVQRSLDAVHVRFGAYVAPGPAMYAGFSQGATLAGAVLLAVKDRFSAVVLAEGGYDLMRNPPFLKRLHANGTARVLVVCGTPTCFRSAHGFEKNLVREGFDVSVAGDPLSGHNLNQRMQDALRAAWPRFVEKEAMWY